MCVCVDDCVYGYEGMWHFPRISTYIVLLLFFDIVASRGYGKNGCENWNIYYLWHKPLSNLMATLQHHYQ